MNPNDIAPMVSGIALALITAGTILLYPISRRLGQLLEAIAQQKREVGPAEYTEMHELLMNIDRRLTMLEDRQSFGEALITSGRLQARPLQEPESGPRLHSPHA